MKAIELVVEVKRAILALNESIYGGYQITSEHAEERARNIVMGLNSLDELIHHDEIDVVITALAHYSRRDSKAMSPAHRTIAKGIADRLSKIGIAKNEEM